MRAVVEIAQFSDLSHTRNRQSDARDLHSLLDVSKIAGHMRRRTATLRCS
ncbi:hypothetical protein [Caudoviricetes sp.]|nr:hypothetical protein [Caudoviricetes sp.]UOF82761.1 hypothetical protein [Caudoviricetes sp.]